MGQKTDIFLRLGAGVVAVDPDRTNQAALKRSFLDHRFRKKPVTIVGKAVSDTPGEVTMFVDEPGSAKNTLNQKWVESLRTDAKRFGSTLQFGEEIRVETVTVEDLISAHGRPFFIKIDVEGHEPAVLRGLRSIVPYVSFEVNLPEFAPEAVECLDLLKGVAAGGLFNYTSDCAQGMALPEWLPSHEFRGALEEAEDPCIEVFFRAE
jgi:FkbM family methyltransferase